VTKSRAIGGVAGAAPGGATQAGSVLERWAEDFAHRAAFANARSALMALLRQAGPPRVWLPAYICGSLVDGALAAGAEVRFYGVDTRLQPHIEVLARNVAGRDAVLIVDHFGRAAPDAWAELTAARPDVCFIEDRAQALQTGVAPLAPTLIYSPRKLIGVADGGLIFCRSPAPSPSAPADDALWAPLDARTTDPDGVATERWRPLYQAAEAAMAPSCAAATQRTLDVLAATPLAPLAAARRANWRVLAKALEPWALWPDRDPVFAPLAFPIVVEDAAATVAALAAQRIWAPRHWAELPSPTADFPDAHRLAAQCVSLPLDPRYGAPEMARVAAAVAEVARPAGAR
jgi:dTDP-4-amino-4,6-dideoxygalactose transaminase